MKKNLKYLTLCFAFFCFIGGTFISLGTALLVGPLQAGHQPGGSLLLGFAIFQITQNWMKNKRIMVIIGLFLLFSLSSVFGWALTLFLYR